MARDEQFDGFSHESLPSVDLDFSCKNEVQSTQPEAVVDIWSHQHCKWIRLPITKVETRVNKDGPADLVTTSRVDLPVTWGKTPNAEEKIPIYDYVGAAKRGSEDEKQTVFDLARVYYWNQYTEEYSIEQFGYVSSIGPSNENGAFRFYIYDAADLMVNISVTKTYDSPTAESVVNFVAYDGEYGLQSNSPIPIREVSSTAAGEEAEVDGAYETMAADTAGWLNENVPVRKFQQGEDSLLNPFREFVDDALDDYGILSGGHKHFRRSRHTLADVMDWLTDEIGGAWYFEPTATGVVLMVNNGGTDDFKIARSAYYDGQFDPEGLDYIMGFNPVSVDVVHNSSLEDLKPINHLELNGESADSFLGVNTDRTILGGPLGAPRGHTKKYPHIEVTYPPLLDRTGGNKLGPKPIESGKTTLAEARKQAVKEFKKAHEDNTDGSIEIRALPSIRPYDYIAAVPVCNDTFDAEMNPIQYEVNSVIHQVNGEDAYKTKLGVSIALNEDELEVSDSYLDIEKQESGSSDTGSNDTSTNIEYCDPPE